MKQIPNDLYKKIQQLNREVKEDLKRQGVVVPIMRKNGTVQVGRFCIQKDNRGFYAIVDFRNETVIGNINLPQAAAVIANKLALGRWIDDAIVNADQRYGHALFDEQVHKKLAEKSLLDKNLDKAEIMFTKLKIAKLRKEQYALEVKKSFEKLMSFR